MELTHVFYSHTEFLDMLKIASDYSKDIKNKVLLINDGEIPSEIKDNFDTIIYYDDSLSYSDKLVTSLSKVQSKYILFTHEVDVILNYDKKIINKLVDLMQLKDIDRLDLQPNGGNSGCFIKIDEDADVTEWSDITPSELNDDDMYVARHTDPTTYVYNVNPSIWKTTSLIDVFNTFRGRTYRDIEYDDVQAYCVNKFIIYNLHSVNQKKLCGYMKSLPFYKYIHVTHYRRLLRFDGSFRDQFGQSYIDAAEDYTNIVNKYNLKEGNRPFL
jgi:hypothetical protein